MEHHDMASRTDRSQYRKSRIIVAGVGILLFVIGAFYAFVPAQQYLAVGGSDDGFSVADALATSTNTSTPTPTCTPVTPLNETFESGTLGVFSSVVTTCVPGGCGWASVTTAAHGGSRSAFAADLADVTDQQLTLNTAIAIPSNASSVTACSNPKPPLADRRSAVR